LNDVQAIVILFYFIQQIFKVAYSHHIDDLSGFVDGSFPERVR